VPHQIKFEFVSIHREQEARIEVKLCGDVIVGVCMEGDAGFGRRRGLCRTLVAAEDFALLKHFDTFLVFFSRCIPLFSYFSLFQNLIFRSRSWVLEEKIAFLSLTLRNKNLFNPQSDAV
jgi:hypothetical protein